MTTLQLPSGSRALLELQRRLSHRQGHYALATGLARLSATPLPNTLDCTIELHWRGLALQAHGRSAALAGWLAEALQGAAFDSLPNALQLALLQQQAGQLPGLVLENILAARPAAAEHSLCLTLGEGERELSLWLQGDLPALLENLPAKPLKEWLALPLALSLQWPVVQLPLAQLRTLALGDVLLLPSTLDDANHLHGHLQGRPWATLALYDNQIEILTMLEAPELEAADNLTDLEQLPVQVSFEIGRHTLDLHTLATLEPGSLIDLHTPLDGEVRILVGQRCIGTGELVDIQGRFGVRVQRLLADTPR
ncbi:type III secretion system cytoplasmic ring protein SctQ [Pseudomonas entomophila]|uniref:type III secretion system cytoplasmic ring protein SctQ n=1 Tax=Pseudomonas entomophila TaxID=312306 RepID=UPI001F025F68|nr:type III secretion system cytoplasmic ring protein SctQ [Pseudomonas entomophila]MCG8291461.1 type III secretion system cytoplasmic ring protein SctQ [Pseudomonas entomophila]